ncbi:MAG: hypothetical protein E7Z70_01815 [Thermoplasmata archaeon]|nr:hypothetical protein [Thermoplasmata archaeon]
MKGTHATTAILAVMVLALAAFVPLMAESSDAAGEPDLSIYRYTPKLTMTSDNFGAVKYIVWDFGDGTVLDGRWEYYIEKQENGESLSADIVSGINAYKALLAQNGNSLIVTTHTYAQKGTYTATAVAMNPLGYVPEGGTAYDGVLNTDYTGYNGGMSNPASADITTPSDSSMETSEFKAIAGSWCRVNYIVEVKGYPTITFDTKGGSAIAPMEVQNTFEYTVATQPADPTKDGCAFNGWFTDSACTQAYDWSLKVTQPMTLYAGWTSTGEEEYDHIITYKDGTTVLGTQNAKSNVNGSVNVQISQDDPTKDNKEFLGWIANPGDTPVKKGATVSVPVTGLTLNASWGEPAVTYTHTISYSANGGTGTMTPKTITDSISGNTPMVLDNNGFTYENQRFVGWKVGNDVYQPGAQIQVGGNSTVTATAQWEETSAPVTTITVYVDGQARVFNAGQTVSDIVKPVQAGYTFDGWYAESGFRTRVSDTTELTDDMHVFSKMTRNAEPSTGIIVKVDGKNVRFDSGKKVSDIEKPIRNGFAFEGWYSDAELKNKLEDGTVLTDGMTVYSKMVESPDNDDDLIPYIVIVIGIAIAIIGLFVHPVVLIIGIAVAAFGGLNLFDIIDLI